MSKANDKSTRTTSHGAEPTSAADSAAATYPNSYAIAAPSSRTKCFRISGIPQDWNQDDLLGALQTIDPGLWNQESQLSLYPACCGSSQTALFELDPTKYFQSLGPNESTYERVFPPSKTNATLTIDSHFYDLTPLNTPDKQIIAEFVASCLPKQNPDANRGLIAV
jgi:hypothetical protein